jgi:hypothetical protein
MGTRKDLPTLVPKLVLIQIIYLDQFGYKKRFTYSCTQIGLNEKISEKRNVMIMRHEGSQGI